MSWVTPLASIRIGGPGRRPGQASQDWAWASISGSVAQAAGLGKHLRSVAQAAGLGKHLARLRIRGGGAIE